MSRISGGCERCRKKKVKCDQERPSCRRCRLRGELCGGYRDVLTLAFRNENEKLAKRFGSASVSTESNSTSENHPSASTSLLSTDEYEGNASDIPLASTLSLEDQAVSSFFDKFVICPSTNGSCPGFLEHLPGLFKEVNFQGRYALRWAVLAAAYASLSKDQDDGRLGDTALDCYGRALAVLGKSLADPRTEPDDYILMAVVVLDLFEGLDNGVSFGFHIIDWYQMTKSCGSNPADTNVKQKQQMTYRQPRQGALPEADAWLCTLDDRSPSVRAEKDHTQVYATCERARALLDLLENVEIPTGETLTTITAIHKCDQVATSWRQSPSWSHRTVARASVNCSEFKAAGFPQFIQLHHDVWTAYEWNYHRTGRIILHRHLLECLHRLQSSSQYNPAAFSIDVYLMKQTSLDVIQTLVNEVLSTVLQMLGYVDNNGRPLDNSAGAAVRKGIGAFFLLWPIKIIKSLDYATAEQRHAGQTVFEGIRDCTGMKTTLGNMSCV